MTFTVEFQPAGIRLALEEPVTLLNAARQAGIQLRADCGGKGICSKCKVQLLSNLDSQPASKADDAKLTREEILNGYRLACETILTGDLKVFVPSESVIEGQVLQVEGQHKTSQKDPAVSQHFVKMNPASLQDLLSDHSRIEGEFPGQPLAANLEVLRNIPAILRENDWKIYLFLRGNKIFHVSKQPLKTLAGLAVDVGSTKIACYLVDLESGALLSAGGTPNPQIAFGEDIMARLGYALECPEHAKQMREILFESVNQVCEKITAQAGLKTEEIADACMVGNTAMHHLMLQLPVVSLSVSPFVPVISRTLYPEAVSLGLESMPGCGIYTPPVIAGFVGSDHLAFLLAEQFGQDNRTRLGIDIGTNTEIALQKGKHIVSVSTASGPAFEGAHIRFGMRAAPGAIEHVSLSQDASVEMQVIGDQPPTGICGSGILDVVAEMRRIGMLNARGRLNKQFPGIHQDSDGKYFFGLTDGPKPITISQEDVDQILLAKGAIRAGIDVLMDHLSVEAVDIEEVVIAGAFGTFMLPEQAMRIGMLPNIPPARVRAVGNAAGMGACLMLASRSARQRAEALAQQIEYLELTVYPDFPLFYARGIQA